MISKTIDTWYMKEGHPWGTEPLPVVRDAVNLMKPGSVLDVGAGDGRNAIFLAKRGFMVTGVDLLESAMRRLEEHAQQAGVSDNVIPVTADIMNFTWDQQFDNVISAYTTHFIPRSAFPRLLANMKKHTTPGGIHIVIDFIGAGPMHKPDSPGYWLEKGELPKLYHGWEIVRYFEGKRSAKQCDEYGNHLKQTAGHLVARKPV